MDDSTLPELRERFRLRLAAAPYAMETIQDGVDLAEADLLTYAALTTPEARIRIGETAWQMGIKPVHPRTMRAGSTALAQLILEMFWAQYDREFAARVIEERGMLDR